MKYLVLFFKLIMTLILLLVILALLPYYQMRFYRFSESIGFSGEHWYNPYQNLDPGTWKLGNFHTHANVYHGLTNGVGTPGDFIKRYRDLGYDFMTMSNYMSMCDTGFPAAMKHACYEHGYGIPKNHQIVFNAREEIYSDFFLFQTRSTEQRMIELLKRDTGAVVALAHPKFRNSYALEDMPYLSGYDLLEVKSHYYWALKHWDAALSAGHKVFLIANDDAHDYNGLFEIAVHGTLVNTSITDIPHVAHALKKGHTMAFSPHTPGKTNWDYKKSVIANREKLMYCLLVNGQLNIKWDHPVKEMRFIGQGGDIRMKCTDIDSAGYTFKPEDTYIRVEADFPSGNSFLLNPVFRTGGPQPDTPQLILWKSIAFCLLLTAIILVFAWCIIKMWTGRLSA